MLIDERERRRAPRRPVELTVHVEHLGRPDDTRADVARNIGSGGVFIDTGVAFPLGTAVRVSIEIGGGPVALEGEVVRVEWSAGRTGGTSERRVRGMAVEFRPGQGALKTLLARLERLPPADAEAE